MSASSQIQASTELVAQKVKTVLFPEGFARILDMGFNKMKKMGEKVYYSRDQKKKMAPIPRLQSEQWNHGI